MRRHAIPILLALALPGCSLVLDPQVEITGRPPIDGPIRAGLIYIGPVGDHGWTKAHDDSRLHVEEVIPELDAHFMPSVSPADVETVIDDFVAAGDNVIITTSHDFLVGTQAAALRHPDVNFLICSGFATGPNLGSYFGRMYQGMYMAGRLAGHATRSRRIGYVGAVVIPETVGHINAFTLGARSVDPEIQVSVRWVGQWFAPEDEAAATNELIDAGADVIFGETDTTTPIETSAARTSLTGEPVYSIGYDNPDSCTFAPDRCLASVYWNWGPALERILLQMRDGEWDPSVIVWDSMDADPERSTFYLSPIDPDLVPTSARLDVEGLIPTLTGSDDAARVRPFVGPLRDTGGAERVAAGGLATDEQILRMCWHVEGVVGLDGQPASVPVECVGDR